MTEFWLAPNVQADILRLLREPELWPRARARTSVLQLYAGQHFLNQGEPGPNQFEALVAAGLFERLREWSIALAVEIGAVKPGGPTACDASDNIHNAHTLLDRVEAAGGQVTHFAIDESIVSGREACGQSLGETAGFTATFIEALRPRVASIGVIEAYPASSAATLQTYMEVLQQLGQSPSFLHLDVDRLQVRDKKLRETQFGADLRHLQAQCRAWGIQMGVILWGQNLKRAKPEIYRADVSAWVSRLRALMPCPADRWIVQSWERTEDGGWTQPHTVPETDRNSQTAVLLSLA